MDTQRECYHILDLTVSDVIWMQNIHIQNIPSVLMEENDFLIKLYSIQSSKYKFLKYNKNLYFDQIKHFIIMYFGK